MSLKALLIALAVVAAFSCGNEAHMSTFYKKLNIDAPTMLQTAEVLDSSEFCPSLAGKSSCCNAESVAEMQDAHTLYTNKIKSTFMKLIEKQITACDKLDALDQTSEVSAKLESVRADTIVSLGKLADQCQEAAIEYTRSVLCMTCDADLNEYTENGKIFVDESDLATVHESCSAFFTEYKKFEGILQNHETKLRNTGCKLHTLATVDSKTVQVCVSSKNAEESLRKYVNAVAQALFNKFEINAKHQIRYNKGVVSVCDSNGCEEQKLPATAAKLFGEKFNTHFEEQVTGSVVAGVARHTAIRKNLKTTWENAVIGGFFEVEAFTAGKTSPAVIELVESGGYRPVQIFQAAAATTTTNSTATNTTAGANATANGTAASPGLAGSIKDKLNSASASIDAYYQTGNTGIIVQVMFAVLTIATTALLI